MRRYTEQVVKISVRVQPLIVGRSYAFTVSSFMHDGVSHQAKQSPSSRKRVLRDCGYIILPFMELLAMLIRNNQADITTPTLSIPPPCNGLLPLVHHFLSLPPFLYSTPRSTQHMPTRKLCCASATPAVRVAPADAPGVNELTPNLGAE